MRPVLVSRVVGVMAVVGLLVVASASPVSASGGVGSSAVVVDAEVDVSLKAPGSSGLTGCEVTTAPDGALNTFESGNLRVTTIRVDSGDGSFDPTVASDSDEIAEGEQGTRPQYDDDEVVDGEVELPSGVFNVYEVTGCDQYEDGQNEIVVVPPSAEQLDFNLRVHLAARLPVPVLELQPFDDDNDWTYVQVPIDVRVSPGSLQGLTVTADTGGPESAVDAGGNAVPVRQWMTAVATPRLVRFVSGDPLADGEVPLECSPAEATAPYVAEEPGVCSYRYRNGSSVTDSNAFDVEVYVEWDVQFLRSDGTSGTIVVEPSFLFDEVRVAEVKAVNVYDSE